MSKMLLNVITSHLLANSGFLFGYKINAKNGGGYITTDIWKYCAGKTGANPMTQTFPLQN